MDNAAFQGAAFLRETTMAKTKRGKKTKYLRFDLCMTLDDYIDLLLVRPGRTVEDVLARLAGFIVASAAAEANNALEPLFTYMHTDLLAGQVCAGVLSLAERCIEQAVDDAVAARGMLRADAERYWAEHDLVAMVHAASLLTSAANERVVGAQGCTIN